MRTGRLFFTVLAVPLDFLAVFIGGLAAWGLRFSSTAQTIRPVVFLLPFSNYLTSLLIVSVFTVFVIAILGLYRFPRPDVGPFSAGLRLFVATSATLATIALTFFFRQELFNSRFLVLAGWIFVTLFLWVERAAVAGAERILARHFNVGMRKALVVGADIMTERLVRILNEELSHGLRVVKRLTEPDLSEIARTVAADNLQVVILADSNYPRERIQDLITFSHDKHLAFLYVPNLVQSLTINAALALVGDIPVIELRKTRLEGWGRVLKRAVDLVGAIVAILFFAPAMAVIALAVKIDDSSGPIVYRNRRAGERGETFSTYKFRSMLWKYSTGPDAPDPQGASAFEKELAAKHSVRRGPVWKILNDPRRTRMGKFLERTSLDELPQFFNVLKGDMSLVGPRPHMLEQVAEYKAEQRRVLAIKPGITGLAQVSGRSDLDFDDEVRLDLYYMEHWSPWMDLKIMAQTPFVVFFHQHRS